MFFLNNRRKNRILEAFIVNHIQIWNEWRKDNLDIDIDLSHSTLSYANLSNTKLNGVNLMSNSNLTNTK